MEGGREGGKEEEQVLEVPILCTHAPPPPGPRVALHLPLRLPLSPSLPPERERERERERDYKETMHALSSP